MYKPIGPHKWVIIYLLIFNNSLVLAGLGDALGVDWASLVADVRRREHTAPTGGARERWKPERVLSRLGLSLNMAGKEIVQQILDKNAQIIESGIPREQENASECTEQNIEAKQNGEHIEHVENNLEPPPDVNSLHPVASIQVYINIHLITIFRNN